MAVTLNRDKIVFSAGHNNSPVKKHISVTADGEVVDDGGMKVLVYLDSSILKSKGFSIGDKVKITINMVKGK